MAVPAASPIIDSSARAANRDAKRSTIRIIRFSPESLSPVLDILVMHQ
jgi:hypothetical protein